VRSTEGEHSPFMLEVGNAIRMRSSSTWKPRPKIGLCAPIQGCRRRRPALDGTAASGRRLHARQWPGSGTRAKAWWVPGQNQRRRLGLSARRFGLAEAPQQALAPARVGCLINSWRYERARRSAVRARVRRKFAEAERYRAQLRALLARRRVVLPGRVAQAFTASDFGAIQALPQVGEPVFEGENIAPEPDQEAYCRLA